jgi:hypothetical protein
VITLRRELNSELNRPAGPRVPVAALRDRYGIEGVAARIDGLYERLLNAPGLTHESSSLPASHQDEDLSPSH